MKQGPQVMLVQTQDLAGLSGGSGLTAELLDDADGALNELSVAVGQLALSVHDVVLHTDADVTAHSDGTVQHLHSGGADTEAAPGGTGAQLLHGILHEHQVLHAARDTVSAAHAELEVQGSLQHALLQIVSSVGDHAGIESLDLGLDAPLLHVHAQLLQELGMVDEQTAVQPVHGTAVVGTHLGLELLQVDLTGLVGGVQVTGGGHVQHDVALGIALVQQLLGLAELVSAHGAVAVLITHMQVSNSSTGLPAGVDVISDLGGSHGDVGVILLLGPSAGGSNSDNALILQSLPISHENYFLSLVLISYGECVGAKNTPTH